MQPKLQVQEQANPTDASEKRRRSLTNDALQDCMDGIATAIPEEAGEDDDDDGDDDTHIVDVVGDNGKSSPVVHSSTTSSECETFPGPSASSSVKRKHTLSKHDNDAASYSAIRVQHVAPPAPSP